MQTLIDFIGRKKADPPKSGPLKALTWKEPFASMMLCDKIETRSRNTNVRGWVLICAGQSHYTDNQLLQLCNKGQIAEVKFFLQGLPSVKGHAIAVAELYDSKKMQPFDEGLTYVKYNPDLYCHYYRNVHPIVPFEFKGSQGWKNLDESIWEKIEYVNFMTYMGLVNGRHPKQIDFTQKNPYK